MVCLTSRFGTLNRPINGVPSISQWSAFQLSHLSVQSRVVDLVLDRFQQAEAEDLPALARFLLQHAAPGAELKKARGACFCWCVVCFRERTVAGPCCSTPPLGRSSRARVCLGSR